jgi:hypothetical protein
MKAKLISIALALIFSITSVTLFAAQAPGASNPLVGTWKLKSYERVNVGEQEKVYPLGEHQDGYVVFTPGGTFSIFLVNADRKAAKTAVATDLEAKELYQSMISYMGTYKTESDKFILKVMASSNQSFTGTELVRFYKIDGNTLTIKTKPAPGGLSGKMGVTTTVFEKVQQAN